MKSKHLVAALAGNPNCGKTTLFNQLTGSHAYVGNWSGVTVEKKSGFVLGSRDLELVDLPGIYSLYPYSMEEIVARDFILDGSPDVIINIVDGTNLVRNLYLTLQLLELHKPLVLAINMMDEMAAKGMRVDVARLEQQLGVAVVPISAKKGTGMQELVRRAKKLIGCADENAKPMVPSAVLTFSGNRPPKMQPAADQPLLPGAAKLDQATTKAVEQIRQVLVDANVTGLPLTFVASKLLEGDPLMKERLHLDVATADHIEKIAKFYEKQGTCGDRETMLADVRYRLIADVTEKTVHGPQTPEKPSRSDRIDRVVTGRFLALPVFLLVIGLMFTLTFGRVGTFLSNGVHYLVYDELGVWTKSVLQAASAPVWLSRLVGEALIGGVGGVLVFLPQIGILFLFLSLLEDSGYMARAAFITDRLMRGLGLSGRSFIPLLMGFGCTTPAVMAARTLENERDRRLTIFMTPFMSCGARLPIYALFAGAFFTRYQGLVVFVMYLLGAAAAVFTGLFFRKTALQGDTPPFVMELPPYRLPGLFCVLRHTWEKCRGFLVKAGTLIFAMSILIWLAQNFNGHFQLVEDPSASLFAAFGRWIAPVFEPLGFGSWQAAVALLSGLVAKEAVVSTLMVLLTNGGSIPLSVAVGQIFTPLSAFSFMVFCLLYMPCISAFASIRRELHSAKWTGLGLLWQLTLAYCTSLGIYQLGMLWLRLFC